MRIGPGIVLVACLAAGGTARAGDGGTDAAEAAPGEPAGAADARAPSPDADLSASPRPLEPINPTYTPEAMREFASLPQGNR